MPKQMMIYEKAAPISKERHRDWSVRIGDFGFAREISVVPLLAAEFAGAAREYPIILSKSSGGYMPAALVGLRENENLFVTKLSRWHGRYIPAFIRRYPFLFMRMSKKDPDRFVLCIDESFSGCNTKGNGEALFDRNGKETEYLKGALKFSGTYQREFAATTAFCNRLTELGILAPQRISYMSPDGKKRSIGGLMTVKKDFLNALPGKKLSELAQSGDLEKIYTHLVSLGNLEVLASRLSIIH